MNLAEIEQAYDEKKKQIFEELQKAIEEGKDQKKAENRYRKKMEKLRKGFLRRNAMHITRRRLKENCKHSISRKMKALREFFKQWK